MHFSAFQIGEIDCDVEEDDRFAYSDELSDVGCLARLALSHVLPTLSTIFDARTHQLINSIKHGAGMFPSDYIYEHHFPPLPTNSEYYIRSSFLRPWHRFAV